jgi:hypothetical protein
MTKISGLLAGVAAVTLTSAAHAHIDYNNDYLIGKHFFPILGFLCPTPTYTDKCKSIDNGVEVTVTETARNNYVKVRANSEEPDTWSQ